MKPKTTHTPGPWSVEQHKPKEPVQIWNQNTHVADLFSHSNESDKANAHLIAAAPTMLEFIEAILTWAVENDHPGIAVSARQTLIKARGES